MHPASGPPPAWGRVDQRGGAMFPDEKQDAEEAFGEWLVRYRDEELGGSIACHGLSSDHLRAAFMAGLLAGTRPASEANRG